MRRYRIKKAKMEINLAPLIDVVFLLLIFFVVASNLNINELQATIQLPRVGIQTETKKNPIILYLDRSGKVQIENDLVPWEMLKEYLKSKPKEKMDGIEVYADRKADFEYIARIMEIASDLGIASIDFTLEYEK